jgi:hypothetical protein
VEKNIVLRVANVRIKTIKVARAAGLLAIVILKVIVVLTLAEAPAGHRRW